MGKQKNQLNFLCDFIASGKPIDVENIRIHIMENYSIFYTYNDAEIRVLVFWDNRQNPELLEKLF